MKPKDSIETYAYRINKEIIHKKKILNVQYNKAIQKLFSMMVLLQKT